MKTLIPPLAAAILILTLVSCQKDATTQPPPKNGGDTTIILSIDTLTDTVSMPLCQKSTFGNGSNQEYLIQNDSMYMVMQLGHKKIPDCQDFVFEKVDFSRFDLIYMIHVYEDNYKNCHYTLVRNDSTKQYLSISEAYRNINDTIYSDGTAYRHLYRVPKLRSGYAVKYIFLETILQ